MTPPSSFVQKTVLWSERVFSPPVLHGGWTNTQPLKASRAQTITLRLQEDKHKRLLQLLNFGGLKKNISELCFCGANYIKAPEVAASLFSMNKSFLLHQCITLQAETSVSGTRLPSNFKHITAFNDQVVTSGFPIRALSKVHL